MNCGTRLTGTEKATQEEGERGSRSFKGSSLAKWAVKPENVVVSGVLGSLEGCKRALPW